MIQRLQLMIQNDFSLIRDSIVIFMKKSFLMDDEAQATKKIRSVIHHNRLCLKMFPPKSNSYSSKMNLFCGNKCRRKFIGTKRAYKKYNTILSTS